MNMHVGRAGLTLTGKAWQIREKLRAAAAANGRTVTLEEYIASMRLRKPRKPHGSKPGHLRMLGPLS